MLKRLALLALITLAFSFFWFSNVVVLWNENNSTTKTDTYIREATKRNQDYATWNESKFRVSDIYGEARIKQVDSIEWLIWNIARFMTKTISAFAILWIIIGGFMVTISGSNEDLTKQGKSTILYSILGLVFTLWAYVLVSLVQAIVFSL